MNKSNLPTLILSFSIIFLSLSVVDNNTWFKIYDSPYHRDNYGYVVCKADGNNYFVVGAARRPSSQVQNIYVIKLNEYGDTLWTRILRDNNTLNSIPLTAVSTPDGGCVMSGDGDISFSVKINSAGGVEWDKTYPGGGRLYDIKNTSDMGFIGCGDISSFSGYILKLDSLGNRQWDRTYVDGFSNTFESIDELVNSEYILTGVNEATFSSTPKALAMKINNQGDTIFNKKLLVNQRGGTGLKINLINQSVLIGGGTADTTNSFSVSYFQKLDTSGNLLFTKIFETNQQEYLYDFKIVNSNQYIFTVARYNFADSVYAKVFICDSSGNILNQKNFVKDSVYSLFSSIDKSNDGYFIFTGSVGNNREINNDNTIVVKTDSNLNYKPVNVPNINSLTLKNEYELLQNYPNPFNSSTNIKFNLLKGGFVEINLYDISGKLVRVLVSEKYEKGQYDNFLDMYDLASGIYFYTLTINKDIHDTKKLILIK